MGTKMTHAARAELTQVVRRRYIAATGAEKRKILDEFIAVTGYHEKSAIRALNTVPVAKAHQTRKRPSLYDEAARSALIVLWEASDRDSASKFISTDRNLSTIYVTFRRGLRVEP
jgi:hypothetical protein